MFRIKTYNAIPSVIKRVLTDDSFLISDQVNAPHGIIARSANLFGMDFGNDLLAIARAGAGFNTIPIVDCAQKGVVVFNTPGANANAVKEMTICALIFAARNVLESIQWTGSLTGEDIPQQAEKGKGRFVGNEIAGKTLGIIGLGATGALVAQAALDLGMTVLGVDPHLSLHAAWKLSNKVESVSEDELIRRSDFITIHAPLTDETKDKYNAELISKTKKGVILLNFSRAAVANEQDIKAALDNGHVKKYIVDFPTSGLLNHPGVISMPHLASGTYEAEDHCAKMAAELLKDYLINGNINHSVNYPSCSMGTKNAKYRLCVLHRNKPHVIRKITDVISRENINIDRMMSSSKGEHAYVMLDLDAKFGPAVEEDIASIADVIRARVI